MAEKEVAVNKTESKKIKILSLSVGVSVALGLWLVLTSKNPRIEDIEKMKSLAQQKEKSLKSFSATPRFSGRTFSSDSSKAQVSGSQNTLNSGVNPQPIKFLNKNDLELIEKIRSQAKSKLATAYTAQMAFFAEWNRYSTDFKSIGFDLGQEKEIPIKMGFLQPYRPAINPDELAGGLKENPERMTTDIYILPGQTKYVNGAQSIDLNQFTNHCRWGCTAESDRFELILAFKIPGYDRIEVWTMDSDKNMFNVINGTEGIPVVND